MLLLQQVAKHPNNAAEALLLSSGTPDLLSGGPAAAAADMGGADCPLCCEPLD